MPGLTLTLEPGDRVVVRVPGTDGDKEVVIHCVKGRSKLAIEAPLEYKITRNEEFRRRPA